MSLNSSWKNLKLTGKLLVSYLKSNWKLFLIGLLLGLILIYFLPQNASQKRNRPPVIGLIGNYTVSTLPLQIQKEISFGLTKLLPDGQATNGAAVSWSASDSGKMMTFNLDQNLFWQDGTKFEASQINYNLKGVEVKRLSMSQIQFIFKEPFSPLPAIVSQPLFKNGLVGLGDYKVQALKFKGRFVTSIELLNQATGERKTYRFFPTESQALTALKLGMVNEVDGLHVTNDLQKDNHYKISSSQDYSVIGTLFFNLRSEKFAEKSFRQGLTYAIPDNFVYGESADGPISKTNWAYSSNIKKYPQNLDIAKALLEKFASPGASVKMNLVAARGLEDVASTLAASWRKMGIEAEITTSDLVPSVFDGYLTYLDLPADPDQYFLWHSTQQGNIAGYKSAKVDRLLEDGRKTLDLKLRKEIYANFERALTEDVPADFLFYPTIYSIKRN